MNVRDSLAKALYYNLFQQIVTAVNEAIGVSTKNRTISILDVVGFG